MDIAGQEPPLVNPENSKSDACMTFWRNIQSSRRKNIRKNPVALAACHLSIRDLPYRDEGDRAFQASQSTSAPRTAEICAGGAHAGRRDNGSDHVQGKAGQVARCGGPSLADLWETRAAESCLAGARGSRVLTRIDCKCDLCERALYGHCIDQRCRSLCRRTSSRGRLSGRKHFGQ
jgi:hypothetical protein